MLKKIFRPWGLQDCCIIICIISLLCVEMFDLASDPGLGWHLSAGEWMLEH